MNSSVIIRLNLSLQRQTKTRSQQYVAEFSLSIHLIKRNPLTDVWRLAKVCGLHGEHVTSRISAVFVKLQMSSVTSNWGKFWELKYPLNINIALFDCQRNVLPVYFSRWQPFIEQS